MICNECFTSYNKDQGYTDYYNKLCDSCYNSIINDKDSINQKGLKFSNDLIQFLDYQLSNAKRLNYCMNNYDMQDNYENDLDDTISELIQDLDQSRNMEDITNETIKGLIKTLRELKEYRRLVLNDL